MEHQKKKKKKKLPRLTDFICPLRGWAGLSESNKKGKFVTKIFFRRILNEVIKSSCENDIQ